MKKIIMIPIPGMNLASYNGDVNPDPRQKVIDTGLEMVNSNIITMKAANNLHTLAHTHNYTQKYGSWDP